MATTIATTPTAHSLQPESAKVPQPAATRNIAVDAYRGFVMFLMMAEVLRLARVAANYPATGSGACSLSTRRIRSGSAARCMT